MSEREIAITGHSVLVCVEDRARMLGESSSALLPSPLDYLVALEVANTPNRKVAVSLAPIVAVVVGIIAAVMCCQ